MTCLGLCFSLDLQTLANRQGSSSCKHARISYSYLLHATHIFTFMFRTCVHLQVALRAAQRIPTDSSRTSDPAQAAIQLPVNTVAGLLSQIGFNRDQPSQVLEDLRMQLGWEVVPILRNRQRLFLFGESPFDSFGPVPPPVPDYSKDLLDF